MDASSSSSSNDSFDSAISDESDWLDDRCLELSEDGATLSGSNLCPACSKFFHSYKVRCEYKQIQYVSTICTNVKQGCVLCKLVLSKVRNTTAQSSVGEEIKLTYMIDESLIPNALDLFISYQVTPFYTSGNTLEDDERACSVMRLIEKKRIEHVITGHECSENTQSNANRSLAIKWLQICKTGHKECSHPKTHETWLPTRLLALETTGSEAKVQVIEPRNGSSQLEYMALSHCWGLKPILTLTAQTANSLKQGVPVALLPRTFRDALDVIAWFDIQYIWIDSLCILQDSAEDWQQEASSMKDVYKNAMGTIAATGASDSSIGCFFTRESETIRGTSIARLSGDDEELFCFDSDIWTEGVDRAPLNQRAWVVQERLLSRRVLHFSQQQMFWECHELDACETFPGGLEAVLPDIAIGFKNLHSTSTSENRLAPQWERVVRSYSKAALTKPSDKIIALAGIATEMESILNDNYLAGLWARNLAEQLVWQVVSNKLEASRPSSYRAPSWSWLSVDVSVEPSSTFSEPVLIQIISAAVESVPGRELSHIQSGSIRLRGVLTAVQWYGLSHDRKSNESLTLRYDGRTIDPLTVTLDDFNVVIPDTIYCLPILPQRYHNREGLITVEGLLLQAMGTAQYKRLGYFRATDRRACEVIEQGPRSKAWESLSNERDKWVGGHLPVQELTLV